jgi:putative transposase
MDALDQAIWQRKTPDNKDLVHHSDRGSQYLSIKYTKRLAEADIDLSVGTVGDAYDNALAECVIGLFKTEVINQIGLWKSMREVEWETLKWPYGDASIAYRLIGRLVLQPPPSRPHQIHPARRSRGDLLCKPDHTRYGRLIVEQIILR